MAKLRDEISTLQDELSKSHDQVNPEGCFRGAAKNAGSLKCVN